MTSMFTILYIFILYIILFKWYHHYFKAPDINHRRSVSTTSILKNQSLAIERYQPIKERRSQNSAHFVSMQVADDVQTINPSPDQHVFPGTMLDNSGHIFELNVLRWDATNFCFGDEAVLRYSGLSSAIAMCSVVYDNRVFILVSQDRR